MPEEKKETKKTVKCWACGEESEKVKNCSHCGAPVNMPGATPFIPVGGKRPTKKGIIDV